MYVAASKTQVDLRDAYSRKPHPTKLHRVFTVADVDQFGGLIGDKNVLHTAADWNTILEEMPHLQAVKDVSLVQLDPDGTSIRPLVHGMLVASLFSSIFASLSPGCVYMNQSLHFSAPVFVNDMVKARLDIEKIKKWRRGGVLLECGTTTHRSSQDDENQSFNEVVIKGTAKVWLPSGYEPTK